MDNSMSSTTKKVGKKALKIEDEVFVEAPKVLIDILNYPSPTTFTCLEKVYNTEAFEVLTSLNPVLNGYSKINDSLHAQNITNLKTLKRFYKKCGHIVDYSKSVSGKGRYIPSNKSKSDTSSFQGMYNIVRRILVNGELQAIDLTNAHIEILRNLCKFLNLPEDKYSVLADYCQNRNKIFEDAIIALNCSRKQIKEFFIIHLFGGDLNTWLTANDNRDILNKGDLITPFMKSFITSLDYIKEQLNKLDIMNGFKLIQKQIMKKKDYELSKSALAIFLQEIESKIFIVMKNKLEELGYNVRIALHDGIWFETNPNIVVKDEELLTLIKATIKKELNLDIPLDFEETAPTKNDLVWYEAHKKFYEDNKDLNENEGLRTDQIYCNNLLKFYKNKAYSIKADDGTNLVMYNEDNGLWTFNTKEHKCIIEKYSRLLFPNIYEKDDKKSFNTLYKSAYELFEAKAETLSCCEWFADDTQIGYLLFKNGVLDMVNFKLLPFDPKYRFTKSINREFIIDDFIDGKKQIYEKLFDKQFTDVLKRDYYIEKISRALAGEYKDREFLFAIGNTSCGKGIQTNFLYNTFGEYICSFNGEELIVKENESSDCSRNFSFIADMYNCRISISNELNIKLDTKKRNLEGFSCNLIKKLVGGGDKFRIRKLYKDPMEVPNKSTPILLVNDLPPTIGVDEAYIKRANYIAYDRSSSTEIETDNELFFKADNTINDFINDPYIINSYIYIICNAYAKSCINKMPRPESVIHTSKEFSGFNDTGADYFNENYKIFDIKTINSWVKTPCNDKGVWIVDWELVKDNYIEINALYSNYIKNGFTTSKVAVGKMLKQKGVVVANKKINGKSVNLYVGIRDLTETD